MRTKDIVRLTDEERWVCEEVIKSQKGKSEKLRRSQILRKADVEGPGWKDEKIGESATASRPGPRSRWCQQGALPPALRIGSLLRWRSSEIDRWLSQRNE